MNDLLEKTRHLIDLDGIKVVSFDLFDTLVLRPAFSDDDILRLLCQSIEHEYGISVLNARLSAGEALGDPCATTLMFWNYAADCLGFSPDLAETFAEKEYEFEKSLLFPRNAGKQLFDYALKKGKRIIVISDMHFSAAQLKDMLRKCGYSGVSELYVSCEWGAVKRTGALFDTVLDRENGVSPGEILHIGDSRKSDYDAPASKGINAVCLPKNRNLFKEYFAAGALLDYFKDKAYENVVYGFAVNHLMECMDDQKETFSLSVYTHLVVFPMLLHVALWLLTEPRIQKSGKYRKLYFASRDGYLTKMAYDILAAGFSDCLESCYLLTSRIACRTIAEDSFFDRLQAHFLPDDCTLGEFLAPTVTDRRLKEKIVSALTEDELALPLCRSLGRCKALLAGFAGELEHHHQEKKKAAYRYYAEQFADASAVLLADCGFCGTISDYLYKGFKGTKKFDKAFFWENEKNRLLDSINGTTTYTAFTGKKGHALGPLVESVFSEQSGSCIGFISGPDGAISPIVEECWQPEKMTRDIAFIQETAVELVRSFCDLFGDLLQLLPVQPLQITMEFIQFFQRDKQFTSTLFANIFFKESYKSRVNEKSLGDLMTIRNPKGDPDIT